MTTAQITASMVKELREKTSAGMMDCKAALEATNGDMEAAVTMLREKGLAAASKLAGRATTEGRVEAYIHGGKIGVLVEVGCNTDFVAMNEDFVSFCRDVAMHVAAMAPRWVSREDVPQELIDAERAIYVQQAADKPENVRDRIADGKLDKWFSEVCLLDQPWIRGKEKFGQDTTIDQYRTQVVQTTGENVEIRRFSRLALGE